MHSFIRVIIFAMRLYFVTLEHDSSAMGSGPLTCSAAAL